MRTIKVKVKAKGTDETWIVEGRVSYSQSVIRIDVFGETYTIMKCFLEEGSPQFRDGYRFTNPEAE